MKPHTYLSGGLDFKKLDLHLHTPASRCFGDKAVTAADIVKTAIAKGLNGIAVTDHNSGAWIDQVKTVAGKLVVFPGVEITCEGGKDGIHMIALFDPSLGTRDIESLLGELKLTPDEYGVVTTVVHKSPIEIAQIITSRGGLAVLAHADSSKGVLQDMAGQQRIQLLQCPQISAAEGTDFQDAAKEAKHRRVVDLLDGTDPNYKRKLAVYQASDNSTGLRDGQHGLAGIGTRCSYFKMDKIDIQALRQCMADPDVRIRQDFQHKANAYPFIQSIKVTGGYLDGLDTTFHGGLNSIIGAKGAGKSLLVEFLRFALNQAPSTSDIAEDHESKLATRLDNYGTVEVSLVDQYGQRIIVERTYDPSEDNPFSENRDDIDKLFPALFLSQNEIIKIAENEDQQIAFIDRFIDFRSHQDAIATLESTLRRLDVELADAFKAYPEVRAMDATLQQNQKEVEKLDSALKNPLFDTFARNEEKDRAVRAQGEFIKAATEQVRIAQRALAIRVPVPPDELIKDPMVKRLQDIGTLAKTNIESGFADLLELLTQRETDFQTEYAKWSPVFAGARKTYEEAIKLEGGDYKNLAQKRASIVKDAEVLRQKVGRLRVKSDRIKDISQTRDEVLNQLRLARENYTTARKEKCGLIEAQSNGRLIVRIKDASNVDAFRARMIQLKKGSYIKDADIEQICTKADSETFVKAVIRCGVFEDKKSIGSLATVVGLDLSRLESLAMFLCTDIGTERLLALQYQGLPQDRPEILYNIGSAASPRFESLKRLSVGQKCAAMLVIALSDGSFPVVIDQPEDSLDIRSIWDDMCSKVRHGKQNRQFIFTTHNSSLAVASDTDKFTIIESDAAGGRVVFSGSMDHAPVSGEVMRYLEGGSDTYRMKFDKYGDEKNM